MGDEAILHYEKAIQLDPTDAVYILNKAAAVSMKKEFEKSISLCNEALEVMKINGAPYKLKAKAYLRIGNAYKALSQYDNALEAYDSSLLEVRDDKVIMAQKKVKKMKARQEEQEYWDEDLSVEAKDEGNVLFKQGKHIEAIDKYTEAIKRNPKNHIAYSNRAACYMKLMNWEKALNDCNRCIKTNETFMKAYIRKGRIQSYLKQYKKALKTYE